MFHFEISGIPHFEARENLASLKGNTRKFLNI